MNTLALLQSSVNPADQVASTGVTPLAAIVLLISLALLVVVTRMMRRVLGVVGQLLGSVGSMVAGLILVVTVCGGLLTTVVLVIASQ